MIVCWPLLIQSLAWAFLGGWGVFLDLVIEPLGCLVAAAVMARSALEKSDA